MPLRLIERICPLGRMLADPPPFSETVLPGGVWLAAFVRVAAEFGRPAVFGRPAALFGRPAVVLDRLDVAERFGVADRFVVAVWPAGVFVWPAVFGRFVVAV